MNKTEKISPVKEAEEFKETCGIIMPISANDSYTAEHWKDVKNILEEVIISIGYRPNIVSDADEIGIIHNRIVTNIYNNPIVICDVSSKNPNVMFELGLRLAFDKATIIITDDTTNYTFDAGVIEHLTYPRDLRYSSIIFFKIKLKEKIESTIAASNDPKYSTFLKHFIQYKPKLETQEISSDSFVLKQLDEISKQISQLKNNSQSMWSESEMEKIRTSDVRPDLLNKKVYRVRIPPNDKLPAEKFFKSLDMNISRIDESQNSILYSFFSTPRNYRRFVSELQNAGISYISFD